MKIDSVPLLYNAAAHFAACEKYPDGLVTELKKENAESFEAMLWAFTEMAKQAELYRRFMGETPRRILTEDEWKSIMRPNQLGRATVRVFEALTKGLSTAADDEDQEIDEVLIELEKKQKKTG